MKYPSRSVPERMDHDPLARFLEHRSHGNEPLGRRGDRPTAPTSCPGPNVDEPFDSASVKPHLSPPLPAKRAAPSKTSHELRGSLPAPLPAPRSPPPPKAPSARLSTTLAAARRNWPRTREKWLDSPTLGARGGRPRRRAREGESIALRASAGAKLEFAAEYGHMPISRLERWPSANVRGLRVPSAEVRR